MSRGSEHPHDEELTANDAKLHIAEQDRRRALKVIQEERARLDRAEANHKKARARFERTIARAVTSDAAKEDWYTRPGPLPADQVREAARLNSTQLHRLMKRHRNDLTKSKQRNRS
jgi:hypothetical protein